MAFHYSQPFEGLLKEDREPLTTARIVVVGSGYGGAVAAYRLAGLSNPEPARDHGVLVLERGREYFPGEFPQSLADLPGCMRAVRSNPTAPGPNDDALFQLRIGQGVDVLVGSGLGGTSLINANVALRPSAGTFASSDWPAAIQAEAARPGSRLDAAYGQIRKWLNVADSEADRQKLRALPKYRALERYGRAQGFDVEPAPITVTLREPRVSSAGVRQKPCTDCGNCVTGCNVSAKNTLTMNLIPAAAERGAEFFTGVQVLRIEATTRDGDLSAPRWRVLVRPVTRETRVRFGGIYAIDADIVVLAAGTLGSTEILQRSQASGKLTFSPRLGTRFSTNGDAVATSFGEREPVHALGCSDPYSPGGPCGPTITAVARGRTPEGDAFTLEDGAIPASLTEVFGDVVTTGAQFARLGNNRTPGWFASPEAKGADLLSVQKGAMRNSQVFLVMGDDGARGRLKFPDNLPDDLDDAATLPVWGEDDENEPASAGDEPSPLLNRIEATLSQFDCGPGQNFGQYVHNPLWRLIPPSAADVMAGRFPSGRLITVHPLGGCPMADHGPDGVVDDSGQVFKGAGDETHPGLYVLDGSIVPRALGVNPFLTIASLAWRACDAIIERLGGREKLLTDPTPVDPPMLPPVSSTPPAPTCLVVTEQMVGMLQQRLARRVVRALSSVVPNAATFDQDVLVLRIRTQPFELSRLERPGNTLTIDVELHGNVLTPERFRKVHPYGIPVGKLNDRTLLACGTGTVTIMSPRAPRNWLQTACRALGALVAYVARRELPSQFRGSAFWPLWKVAVMHATYRDFHYRMPLWSASARDCPQKDPAAPHILIQGTKRIAWRPGHARLWAAFTRLKTRVRLITGGKQKKVARITFTVDVENLVGEGLLQVQTGSSVPSGILACLSFVLRMARCALQAGLWEFGAPDYPPEGQAPQSVPWLPRQLKNGLRRESFDLQVPCSLSEPASGRPVPTLPIRLHAYRHNGGRKPVLLVHGLAQGSLIYAHPAMNDSMADYFSSKGYDVWLLDYRLSNQFSESEIPYGSWSIDEIGAFDVPLAVETLLKHYPDSTQLHVFAHCVGAIGTTMAILRGRLPKNRIASVVLNAIHPWIFASAPNRVRAKLGVFFRDWLDDSYFNPIIQSSNQVGPVQSLLDRLGFSLARLDEDVDGGHRRKESVTLANAICDRMTFLYGRMWRHPHVEALHESWKDLVGRAPGSVQRHLYYLLLHHRVVDRQGLNAYLRDENLRNWQGIRTLFIHGEESRVFSPQSATQSAVRLRAVLEFLRAQHPLYPHCPPPVVGLRRIPDYGHMDVILAGSAPEESYRYIKEFFEGEFDKDTTSASGLKLDEIRDDDDAQRSARTKLIGPVLRGARLEGNQLVLRLWMQLPVDNASPVKGIESTSIVARYARLVHQRPELHQEKEDSVRPKRQRAETHEVIAGILTVAGDEPHLEQPYIWVDVTLAPDQYRRVTARIVPGGARTGLLELPHADGDLYWQNPSAPIGAVERPAWLRRLMRKDARDCHFFVGSCRYPGTPFDQSGADQAFEGMHELLDRDIDCDLLFLIGDQIYADATNGILDPVRWRDRYVDRYRSLLDSAAVAAVLNAVPCHFAIDDHEFVDNYAGCTDSRSRAQPAIRHEGATARALRRGDMTRAQFQFARAAAQAYMGSGRSVQQRSGTAVRRSRGVFWYALDDPAEIRCPAFILDTRSERERARPGVPARLMSPGQMSAFKGWLTSHQGVDGPKFVFLGSPIIPLTREFGRCGVWMRQDGPTGYPVELADIVSHIADNEIRGVVFVGGDAHLSCVARMRLTGTSGEKAVDSLHIVASGLYAPLPFANFSPAAADWCEPGLIRLRDQVEVKYEQHLLISGPPHFLRVSAVPEDGVWTIRVQAYGSSGAALGQPFAWTLRAPAPAPPAAAPSVVPV